MAIDTLGAVPKGAAEWHARKARAHTRTGPPRRPGGSPSPSTPDASSPPPADAPLPVDASAAAPPPSPRKESTAEVEVDEARKQQLEWEVQEVGTAGINRYAQEANAAADEATKGFQGKTATEKEAEAIDWEKQNRGASALVHHDRVAIVNQDSIKNAGGVYKLDRIGRNIAVSHNGVDGNITGITGVTGNDLLCTVIVDGTPTQVSIPRETVQTAILTSEREHIIDYVFGNEAKGIEAQTENAALREVMETHLAGGDLGVVTEQNVGEWDSTIVEAAKACGQGWRTVDTAEAYINRVAPDYSDWYPQTAAEAGKKAEATAKRTELRKLLDGRNILDFDRYSQLLQVDARTNIATIEAQIRAHENAKVKAKGSEIDDIRDEVMQLEIHKQLLESVVSPDAETQQSLKDSFEALANGTVSPEQMASAEQAMRAGRPDQAIGAMDKTLLNEATKEWKGAKTKEERIAFSKKWGKRGGMTMVALIMGLGMVIKAGDE